MKESLYLNQEAIQYLFKIKFTITNNEKPITVDLNLLIGQIVTYPAFNEQFYSLCDLTHNYSNFIFSHKVKRNNSPRVNDIIKVQLISSYYDNQHQLKMFVIHELKVIGPCPFMLFSLTQEYNASNGIVFLRNEPLSHNWNVISHISTLPTSITLFIKVLTKTCLISYKNNKGIFFYFEIIDQENKRLRVVAFNSTAQLFYPMITINSYYQIKGNFAKQKGSYKIDDKLEEIYLSGESQVIKLTNNDELNEFHTIQSVLSTASFNLVNIMGKVVKVNKMIFHKDNGSKIGTKTITICDVEGYKIDVQLCNHHTLYMVNENDIIALYNIQKKHYESAKLLVAVSETKIAVNPKSKEATALANFFNKVVYDTTTDVVYYPDLRINELNYLKDSTQRFRIKGIINHVDLNSCNYYKGCTDLSCKGTITNNGSKLKCLKCDKTIINPQCYYTLHAVIQDCTGTIEALLLNKAAYDFLELNAYYYEDLFESGKQHILQILAERSKFESYYFYISQITTTLIEINRLEKVNTLKESRSLITKIKSALLNTSFVL